jgi:cell pole-organizing protein PopZ
MTIINGAGHHNVEDILASIRTSIAEEGTSARSIAGEIQTPAGRREPIMAEEAADFELPAIFKPGHQSHVERPKLLGRLSDALKTNPGPDAGRTRTVIPFDPNGIRSPETQASASSNTRPAPSAPIAPQAQPQQSAPAPASNTDVKRVMPTFFDTRISKMGELTKNVHHPEPPKPEPPKAQEPVPPVLPQLRAHPMLPEGNLAHHRNAAAEDAAAQLLRPMLRQWLSENMPKIVEKALLSEAGFEQPQNPKKPGT